ncbi:MAG: hypothetical protein ACM31J_07750 [Nitrososphaerales archaeon]
MRYRSYGERKKYLCLKIDQSEGLEEPSIEEQEMCKTYIDEYLHLEGSIQIFLNVNQFIYFSYIDENR